MSGHGGTSWLPWRGPSPVRWTLVFALLVVAALAAGVPSGWRTVSGRPGEWWNATVPPVATWSALLALVLAIWPAAEQRRWRWSPWPWRGPDPLRNTVAFVLDLAATAVLLLNLILLPTVTQATRGVYFLVLPVYSTLNFASALASTRRLRGEVTLWAFVAGLSWGWYVSYLR